MNICLEEFVLSSELWHATAALLKQIRDDVRASKDNPDTLRAKKAEEAEGDRVSLEHVGRLLARMERLETITSPAPVRIQHIPANAEVSFCRFVHGHISVHFRRDGSQWLFQRAVNSRLGDLHGFG